MKKFLMDLIARNKTKLADVEARMKSSENIDEVRSLGEQAVSLRSEIAEAEAKLAEAEKEETKPSEPAPTTDPSPVEGRSSNGFNPMASYGLNGAAQARSEDVDSLSTEEYRKAFMNYVQDGTLAEPLQLRNNKTMAVTEYRADAANVLGDVGVLLPNTVVQEIMKEVEKVHGQLYSRVKKLNIAGGLEYPIGSFSAEFHRTTETTKSDRQKVGSITGSVKFTYHIGEIRIAQTLLSKTISVAVFEKELAKTIVEAYVQAMDNEILNGTGSGEMEGIITELNKTSGSRIPAANVIEFTADEMLDWKNWQTKLFAKIPLSMRKIKPQFAMTANTYEANIKTLHDDNNRPVYAETFNPIDGTETATFKGKQVVFVEEGLNIENFNDAADGEVFGLYWVPEKAYAVNTNLQFATRRYFDEETNEWVTKALVINDGKVLDPKYLYILKKKVSA